MDKNSRLSRFLDISRSPILKALGIDATYDLGADIDYALENTPKARLLVDNALAGLKNLKTGEDLLKAMRALIPVLGELKAQPAFSKFALNLTFLSTLALTACGNPARGPEGVDNYIPAVAAPIVPGETAKFKEELQQVKTALQGVQEGLEQQQKSVDSLGKTAGSLNQAIQNVAGRQAQTEQRVAGVIDTANKNTAAMSQTLVSLQQQAAETAQKTQQLESGVAAQQAALLQVGSMAEAAGTTAQQAAEKANTLSVDVSDLRNAQQITNSLQIDSLNEAFRQLAEVRQGLDANFQMDTTDLDVHEAYSHDYFGFTSLYVPQDVNDPTQVTVRLDKNIPDLKLIVSRDNMQYEVQGTAQADGSIIFSFPFQSIPGNGGKYLYLALSGDTTALFQNTAQTVEGIGFRISYNTSYTLSDGTESGTGSMAKVDRKRPSGM